MGVRGLFLALLLVVQTACSQAADATKFPYFDSDGGRIRDKAKILSPETESRLEEWLEDAEAEFGQQMVIVTVSSLHGMKIGDFSLGYANAWGIGDAVRNDGLQLLVAPSEREVRIEVGLGLERTFTDEYCQQVVDLMLPYFREGKFDEGVTAGTEELVRHMRLYPSLPANDDKPDLRRGAA